MIWVVRLEERLPEWAWQTGFEMATPEGVEPPTLSSEG